MICHPDAFLRRWILFPNGKDKAKMPFPDKVELQRQAVILTLKKTPSIVSEDNKEEHQHLLNSSKNTSAPRFLVTGQIPRNAPYEKRFPMQYKKDPVNGDLVPDPLVNDGQATVADLREKGLVVISGCAHAGIINTVIYAKSLTGISNIFAIVGGFLLTGGGNYEGGHRTNNIRIEKYGPTVPGSMPLYRMESYKQNNSGTGGKISASTPCTTFTLDSTI